MRVSGHSLRWEHPRVWLAALLMTSVFFFSVMTGHAQSTPPAPTITSISPSVVAAGKPDFFLIVNGTNFIPQSCSSDYYGTSCSGGSQVNWGGSPHLTGFINVKQLYALIHSWDVAQPKVYDVTVDNGSSDGGLSNAVQLTVTAGPIISGLSPSSASAGAPEFALTISGSNFVQTDTVQWNGSKFPTTFVSSTQLTVAVPATNTAQAGTATVTVVTSDGALSNPLSFSITPPPLAVSVSSFPKGILGTPYTVTLKASNGTPPYSWSISAGVLPAGLTLDSSSGLVSGTPTATGNFTFTVRVSDQSQQTASQSFSVTIGAPIAPPASISGIGDTIEPGQQPGVGVSLGSVNK